MERVEEFKVGDWARIRPTLTTAKHGLGSVIPGSIGIVYCIRPDDSLLLDLSYLPNPWHCEPEEVEPVVPFKVSIIFWLCSFLCKYNFLALFISVFIVLCFLDFKHIFFADW